MTNYIIRTTDKPIAAGPFVNKGEAEVAFAVMKDMLDKYPGAQIIKRTWSGVDKRNGCWTTVEETPLPDAVP